MAHGLRPRDSLRIYCACADVSHPPRAACREAYGSTYGAAEVQ